MTQQTGKSANVLIIATVLAGHRQTLCSLSEVNLGYNVWVLLGATGAKKETLCFTVYIRLNAG